MKMEATVKEPVTIDCTNGIWNAWRNGLLIAAFEHRHDAERFAASEELLAACRAAVESSGSPSGGECRCGACNMARAAIAKAEARDA